MPHVSTNDGVTAPLRGDRRGRAGAVRPRVRRRPPQLGAAGPRASAGATAASPTPRAATRRPTCRRTRRVLPGARRRRRHRGARRRRRGAAHVVGLSMGGFATLHLGLRHPERALSLVVAGVRLRRPARAPGGVPRGVERSIAAAFADEGAAEVAKRYAVGPARVQFQNKDPRGWAEFARAAGRAFDATGRRLTMRGVQARAAVALRPDRRARARSTCRC